jgi:hypothetical protein
MPKRPKFDPEIAALLPPLTKEELAELEKKASTEGFRDALVVWCDSRKTTEDQPCKGMTT